MGDLRAVGADREAFKVAVAAAYPETKGGAIPVTAGVLHRFVNEMQAGDIVVYPSKVDRMVNIGRFTGETEYVADSGEGYPNRRKVSWLGRIRPIPQRLTPISASSSMARVRRRG